jgi:hypothetical protein
MMPQSHFVVAVLVTTLAIILFYPDMVLVDAGIWCLVSGIVAAIIDLDVILITRRAARTDPELAPFASPMEATKDLKAFLVLIYRKGLFDTVKWTHLGFGVVVTLLAYILAESLLVPVAIGAWSHLATDVPYLWSIKKAAMEDT